MTEVTLEYGRKSRAFAYTQEMGSDDDGEQSSTDWGDQLVSLLSDEDEDGSFSDASSVTVSDLDGDLREDELDDFGSKGMFSLCCAVGVFCVLFVLVGRAAFGEDYLQDFALSLLQPLLDWVRAGGRPLGTGVHSGIEGVVVWSQAMVDMTVVLLGHHVFQPLSECSKSLLDLASSASDWRFSFAASFHELVVYAEDFVVSLKESGVWSLRGACECAAVVFGVVKVWVDQVLECVCVLYEGVRIAMVNNVDSFC